MKDKLIALAKSKTTWALLALALTALAALGTDVRPGLCEAVCAPEAKP